MTQCVLNLQYEHCRENSEASRDEFSTLGTAAVFPSIIVNRNGKLKRITVDLPNGHVTVVRRAGLA